MSCVQGGECDGCSWCLEDAMRIKCAVCGEELWASDVVYLNDDGVMVGCEHCLYSQAASYCAALSDDEKGDD